MADARMPEKFYQLARPMLPAETQPGRQGGRPRVPHYSVLKVIWFVLVTGCRWKDVPMEMGCCGETARTRLQAWERAGIWNQLHRLLLTILRQEDELHLETVIIDSTQVRAFGGGDTTGPSPVDRRKKGTKYTLLVDREGVPLGIEPHIRRRNHGHGSHLGRVRWVVERTISWIKGLRRMRVRYDRSDTSIDAWTTIAAAVVCLKILMEAIA